MIKEWKSFTRRQKIIIGAYLVMSLPLLPLMAIMIPFSWWIVAPQGGPTRKLTLIEFASISLAMSLFTYGAIGIAYFSR